MTQKPNHTTGMYLISLTLTNMFMCEIKIQAAAKQRGVKEDAEQGDEVNWRKRFLKDLRDKHVSRANKIVSASTSAQKRAF